MDFKLNHRCVQCAEPITLNKGEWLSSCPSCATQNILASQNIARLVVPAARQGERLVYVPYIHTRGTVFACDGQEISSSAVKVNVLGATALKFMPKALSEENLNGSLALAEPKGDTLFLKNGLSLKQLQSLTMAEVVQPKEHLYHKTFVTHSSTIIYMPLAVYGGSVFDGMSGKVVADLSDVELFFESLQLKKPGWKFHSVAGECPQCATPLAGAKTSTVFFCHACNKGFHMMEKGLEPVSCLVAEADKEKCRYLPFWKIKAYAADGAIKTYGDFAGATNQAEDVQAKDTWDEMHYWVPAFDLSRPHLLEAAKRCTVGQPGALAQKGVPQNNFHAVSTSLHEALHYVKLVFAHAAENKEIIFSWLPRLRFQVKAYSLVMLPFAEDGENLSHEETGISLPRADLIQA